MLPAMRGMPDSTGCDKTASAWARCTGRGPWDEQVIILAVTGPPFKLLYGIGARLAADEHFSSRRHASLESLARGRRLLLTPLNLLSFLKTSVAPPLNPQGDRAVGQDRSPIGPSPYPHPFPTSRLKRQRSVVHASHELGAPQCTCTTLLMSSWVRAGWSRAGPLTINMSGFSLFFEIPRVFKFSLEWLLFLCSIIIFQLE